MIEYYSIHLLCFTARSAEKHPKQAPPARKERHRQLSPVPIYPQHPMTTTFPHRRPSSPRRHHPIGAPRRRQNESLLPPFPAWTPPESPERRRPVLPSPAVPAPCASPDLAPARRRTWPRRAPASNFFRRASPATRPWAHGPRWPACCAAPGLPEAPCPSGGWSPQALFSLVATAAFPGSRAASRVGNPSADSPGAPGVAALPCVLVAPNQF
jgi:hypothetical protein